jgi:hypothetical protein
MGTTSVVDAPSARALAAVLPRMPALRALELHHLLLPGALASELFRASSAEDVPQLRTLAIESAGLAPAAARALAASGWHLEELGLLFNRKLGAAGLAALVAAPPFAVLSSKGLLRLPRRALLLPRLPARGLGGGARGRVPHARLDVTHNCDLPILYLLVMARRARERAERDGGAATPPGARGPRPDWGL